MEVFHEHVVAAHVPLTDMALPRIVALTVTTHVPAPTRPTLT